MSGFDRSLPFDMVINRSNWLLHTQSKEVNYPNHECYFNAPNETLIVEMTLLGLGFFLHRVYSEREEKLCGKHADR